jgi:hypothetical protein
MLILMGVLWTVYGLTLVLYPNAPPRFSEQGNPIPILSLFDLPGIGWLWGIAGVVAIAVALCRRYYAGHDAWGFNALLVPSTVWTLAYLWSDLLWIFTGHYGRSTSGSGATAWLIVCTFIVLLAGWPDPDDPAVHCKGG